MRTKSDVMYCSANRDEDLDIIIQSTRRLLNAIQGSSSQILRWSIWPCSQKSLGKIGHMPHRLAESGLRLPGGERREAPLTLTVGAFSPIIEYLVEGDVAQDASISCAT